MECLSDVSAGWSALIHGIAIRTTAASGKTDACRSCSSEEDSLFLDNMDAIDGSSAAGYGGCWMLTPSAPSDSEMEADGCRESLRWRRLDPELDAGLRDCRADTGLEPPGPGRLPANPGLELDEVLHSHWAGGPGLVDADAGELEGFGRSASF